MPYIGGQPWFELGVQARKGAIQVLAPQFPLHFPLKWMPRRQRVDGHEYIIMVEKFNSSQT